MSETEQNKETQVPVTDPNPEVTAFYVRMGKELTTDFTKDMEAAMKTDTIEKNGESYKFNPIKGKDIIRFKKLDIDSFKITDKDGEDFYNNVRDRACIVIQDMTPDKFDNGDYVVLENLTMAWSTRAIRGFHR